MILGGTLKAGAWPAWLAVLSAWLLYLAIFLPLLPADGVGLGADYLLHLPNLLAGDFLVWTNGLLSVPWFSPAQCGGVPFLADLNVGFYSVPQFLSFLVDPLLAVRVTFAVFAAVGAIGSYVLARRAFAVSPQASAVAAAISLFNGCYAARMIAGHLTFHPVMLAPWIVLCVIRATPLAALVAGALFAYAFQSGMIHGIGPVALATAALVIVHGIRSGHRWQPWAALAATGVIAIALSANRLVAAVAFAHNFPRDRYPLAGFANLLTELRLALQSLFFFPPTADAWASLVNTDIFFNRQEWDYGVGPAAGLLILAGAAALVLQRSSLVRRHLAAIAALVAILAIPLLLNWYVPAWNAALKQVPLLGSSTTLVRWYIAYIPIATLMAALAFDRLIDGHARLAAMAAIIATIVLPNWLVDKSSFQRIYDARPVVAAWHRGVVPPVTANVATINPAYQPPMKRGDNNALADGRSELNCYQPMFGYQLQDFPVRMLHAGPIADVSPAGTLNLRNPACYLYPDANRCMPGDEFPVEQKSAALAFASYRALPFDRPPSQVLADWLNRIALIAWPLAAAILLVRRPRRGVAASGRR
jgi:hypothetical protein